METGWKWSLSLQCLRSLLQNEWTEQTSCETKEEIGKYYSVADNQKKSLKIQWLFSDDLFYIKAFFF